MKRLFVFGGIILFAIFHQFACGTKPPSNPGPVTLVLNNPTPTPNSGSSGVTVTTLAGLAGVTGSTNSNGTNATFFGPIGIAVDTSGNVYVADQINNMIREITSGGVVSTLAGQLTSGSTNATGTAASFYWPHGVAVDSTGNVYVADRRNYLIRKIALGGAVTTLRGRQGYRGHQRDRCRRIIQLSRWRSGRYLRECLRRGCSQQCNPENHTSRCGNDPGGVGRGYWINQRNWYLCIILRSLRSRSRFSGNVYVADAGNHLIREITSGGVVSTLAGQAGVAGATNAIGTAASFNDPSGVAVDSSGNVYVADYGNHVIRKITSGGVVSVLAGSAGVTGYTNGTGATALFNYPAGVAVNSAGTTVYVADSSNNLIRVIQ